MAMCMGRAVATIKSMRVLRYPTLIVMGWYLFLALGHYSIQRPLWNDEQGVLNCIVHLKPIDIFNRPLLSDQAFPRLYLLAIQQFSNLFDQSLLSLRLFSLMVMLGAFFIWANIARRVLDRSWDLVLFIGTWCGSLPLVYYAAELKPYSMDVLASGLIVLFLLDQDQIQKNPKTYRTMLMVFPLLGFWSYPALFLLLLPLYNLVRESIEKRCWLPELTIYLIPYMVMLGMVYMFDFRVSARYLVNVYWHDYFISFDSVKHFFNSFGKGINNLIARRFAEEPKWIKIPSRFFIGLGVAYMLVSFWGQFKKDRFMLRSIVPMCMALFLIQLALAVLRIFPFSVPRLSLFYSPMLFLTTILLIRLVYQHQKPLGTILRLAFAGYLIFISLGIAREIVLKKELSIHSMLYCRS